MAITPQCDKCGQELTDYGALLFSPPDSDSKVVKYHLCKACFRELSATLKPRTDYA